MQYTLLYIRYNINHDALYIIYKRYGINHDALYIIIYKV